MPSCCLCSLFNSPFGQESTFVASENKTVSESIYQFANCQGILVTGVWRWMEGGSVIAGYCCVQHYFNIENHNWNRSQLTYWKPLPLVLVLEIEMLNAFIDSMVLIRLGTIFYIPWLRSGGMPQSLYGWGYVFLIMNQHELIL